MSMHILTRAKFIFFLPLVALTTTKKTVFILIMTKITNALPNKSKLILINKNFDIPTYYSLPNGVRGSNIKKAKEPASLIYKFSVSNFLKQEVLLLRA